MTILEQKEQAICILTKLIFTNRDPRSSKETVFATVWQIGTMSDVLKNVLGMTDKEVVSIIEDTTTKANIYYGIKKGRD